MALTQQERQEILEQYKDLRVADVRDGMDWMMQHHYGSMSCEIRPLWRTRAIGFARTCRYVAYDQAIPQMTPDEYSAFSGMYYNKICTYPWETEIIDGDFIVIDMGGLNVGLMGSNNGLSCFSRGARGLVSNGGVRDTDELILQKVPFWSKSIAQTMVQGRLKFESKDTPVCVGGVTVYPEDLVVADGDGVIVVPQKLIYDVAKYAKRELEGDKIARKQLYEKVGLPMDDTVL